MPADWELLGGIRAAVLDMDGVLWRGNAALPGLVELFEFFDQAGISYILATNNSTTTVNAYVEKLRRFGVTVRPESIVTSAVATADYLRLHYGDGVRVHVVGEAGLIQTLAEAGYSSVAADANVVVVGLDREVTYEKLRRASTMIRNGARFIGTNADRTFPMPDGLVPGAGSLLAFLQACTDQQPLVIGKPEATMFAMALTRLGTRPDQTLMVGDRVDTDVVGARQAGLLTALVLSGVTSADMLASSPAQPDLLFDDIAALRQAWQSVRGKSAPV
ncbi:MAG: HAD-IIA family hydrolase [Anaerolineae bacterium]|nr:HAD-IIA family hydrolase [Anaerolineae bacterium]